MDVDGRTDVTFEVAVLSEPGLAGIENPSIFAIGMAEPKLRPK